MICLVKRLFLLVFLIVAIQACKKPDNFGTEVQPQGSQFGVVMSDTFTINTSTVRLDSFNTAYPFHMMVGNYKDPITGTISADAYTQILPTVANFTVPAQFTYDSLVLIMHANYVYGDSTQPFSVDVYHLTETLDTAKRYSNQSVVSKEMAPIGTATYLPGLKRELRVTLSNTLGRELYEKAVRLQLSTVDIFNEYFKGLAIVSKEGNKAMVGFATAYSSNSDTANVVRMYTHLGNESYKFDMSLNGNNLSFNKFSHDLNGSSWVNLTKQGDAISSELTSNQLVIQGGGSLMAKLNFPGIENFRKQFSNIVIVKAELIITPETPSLFVPPNYVNVYKSNSKNRVAVENSAIAYVQEIDPRGYLNKAYGYYNSTNLNYSINLTSYFQELMYNRVENNGILIGAGLDILNLGGTNLAASNVSSVNRMIFGDSKAVVNPLKLKVYYQSLR